LQSKRDPGLKRHQSWCSIRRWHLTRPLLNMETLGEWLWVDRYTTSTSFVCPGPLSPMISLTLCGRLSGCFVRSKCIINEIPCDSHTVHGRYNCEPLILSDRLECLSVGVESLRFSPVLILPRRRTIISKSTTTEKRYLSQL
jgi:hypothetical protein